MGQTKLRIAIQKSGRLYEESVKLLNECGIDLRNVKDRLKTESDSFPLEVFFFRDDDIPQYVEDGVADIGIVGENVLLEKNKKAAIVEELGFGKCRLSIAVPRNQLYEGVASLKNKRIATSYRKNAESGKLEKTPRCAGAQRLTGWSHPVGLVCILHQGDHCRGARRGVERALGIAGLRRFRPATERHHAGIGRRGRMRRY